MASSKLSTPKQVSVLEYLRSKSSVDFDSLDLKACKALGRFPDCTSNQWEAYTQLSDPENAPLLKDSLHQARKLHARFSEVNIEELGVEIGMLLLAQRMIPLIYGSIHVMCNPLYSWDSQKVFDTGHRLHRLCRAINPSFDVARLIMKVPATWEGLQACKRLSQDGIKTLATTLFTIQQAVLAGEAGCISISPFTYELRAHYETSYHDSDPILNLNLQAQLYYQQHGVPTKVKACCFMTNDEVISMAGVDAMTLPAEVLQELSSMTDTEENLESRSLFLNAPSITQSLMSYIDDKVLFDREYTLNGRGRAKTEDAIAVFCVFQTRAEALMSSSYPRL